MKQTTKKIGLLIATALAALLLLAPAAFAAPRWQVESLSASKVAPGAQQVYLVTAINVGDGRLGVDEAGTPNDTADDTPLPYTLTIDLPPGVKAVSAYTVPNPTASLSCPPVAGLETIVCDGSGVLRLNSGTPSIYLLADTGTASGEITARFEVEGGGAANAVGYVTSQVTADPPAWGIEAFDSLLTDKAGAPFTEAASVPWEYKTWIDFETTVDEVHSGNEFDYNTPGFPEIPGTNAGGWPVEAVKDLFVELPPGLVGNPAALAQCTAEQLANTVGVGQPTCPPASQVGTTRIHFNRREAALLPAFPVFNMVPPVGAAARFGFVVSGVVVVIDAVVRQGDYAIVAEVKNISKGLAVAGSELTPWGVPASEVHRFERACRDSPIDPLYPTCPAESTETGFLRLPTSCPPAGVGIEHAARADSWVDPGDFDAASTASHELPGYPAPPSMWGPEVQGVTGCDGVPVDGKLDAKPTTRDTETASGLNVHVEIPGSAFDNPDGISTSDVKKVKVTLPEGLTVNPSQAEGLGSCSQAQLTSTVLSFFPTDRGCPENAKIGSVEVDTPLLDEDIKGDVYVAQPYENPFGSLLALYVVLHNEQRGILIKLAGKVETNPTTGQITTTFDDLPQQPVTSFDFHFREGARAPLVTPAACGIYATRAEFTGWSDPNGAPVVSKSQFQVDRGIGGGPCPKGGLPPFKPGLIAGTRNPIAGAYSPFDFRLFRTDAEQHFVHFSTKLPPGISGKLAGISFCPDAAIAAAKSRTGAQELTSPSCPESSYIGKTLVGAGVGSVQAYVPGKIYLAGPYNGSALSIAAITAAKIGPFDLGTVVIREALRINPETVEVFIDPTGSDPLPHIIAGIPTKIRDIRATVDRHEFVLNPTSCDPTSTASTMLGSGFGFATNEDDEPVTVTSRFQVANCDALAFKPDLKLSLKGGTKRAGHPKLRAVLKMRKGEANIQRAQVTLPKSAFLDQSHIGTVCTRVQFAKDQCPAKSVYGYARAFTPLLEEPVQGPVYLRSSEHKLPDLVARLRSGKIEVHLVGRIDSLDGRIRNTFEAVPDAPVSKFVLTMQGGKKGLLENSTNLCARPNRAILEFDAQNGKIADSNPIVRPTDCSKAKRKAAKRRAAR